MVALDFRSLFFELQTSGFYEYVLPFLLVFVVLFAILEKTFILGSTGSDGERQPKTNLNAILAVILALVLLLQPDLRLVEYMNIYLSKMSFFIVLAVMAMLVIALFAGKNDDGKMFSGFGMLFAVAVAVFAVLWSLNSSYGGYGWTFLPYWVTDEILTLVFFVVILGVIIATVTKKAGETGRGEKFVLRSAH